MSAPWVQCTSVSNECLGGCRSMREHDAHRHATLTRERDEALNVIRELRCKLAEAGVEGSPPAGETTIGALMRQRDEARAGAARCRELLTKSLTFIWDMNRPSVMRRFEQEDAVRAALADTTSEAWLAEVRAAARDEALEEAASHAESTSGSPFPSEPARQIRQMKRGGK